MITILYKCHVMSCDCTCLPEGFGVCQVEGGACVVCQDEGEDGVLHEIIEGPPSQFVELHQVLKVGHLPLDPTAGIYTHTRDVAHNL